MPSPWPRRSVGPTLVTRACWHPAMGSKESQRNREEATGIWSTTNGTIKYRDQTNINYCDHSHPGNQNTALWRRRLRFVSVALLAYAVYESKKQGFGGILGLHAADQTVEDYYKQFLPGTFGVNVFLPETKGIRGPAPRGDAFLNQLYFETTTEGSEALLESYRYE
jgi:hypothetical protein